MDKPDAVLHRVHCPRVPKEQVVRLMNRTVSTDRCLSLSLAVDLLSLDDPDVWRPGHPAQILGSPVARFRYPSDF
jgi:hypothetical protein